MFLGGFSRDVVTANEDPDGDEEEDEQGGHGEEVPKDGELSEEGDHPRRSHHRHGGVDGRACLLVHNAEPGGNEVRSCDVGQVASLAYS